MSSTSAQHKEASTDSAAEVRVHVETLHQLAAGIDGVLVVSTFHASIVADDDRPGTITHHPIGDVDGMVDAIAAHLDTPGANVYVGLQVMQKGIARGKRGTEADIVAVLGLVADMDGDTGKVGDLPIEPNIILETSPGNGQPFWLFDRALTPGEAKPLAVALKRATGSDHGTADIAHVWRVPGTMNWPNRKKLERGRSPDPVSVIVAQGWDGSLTSVEALTDALAPWMHAAAECTPVAVGDLPDAASLDVGEKAAAFLAANEVGDRSAHAARVVEQLAFDGHTAESALALFLAASGDWLAKYATEELARKDFARCWGKHGAKHGEQREAAAAMVGDITKKALPQPANDNTAPVDLWARHTHPSLPSGLLPPVIEEYARVQAEMMGVDAGGLAASVLAVCAAAIPDSIQLKVKRHDDWMESPRIWVALIGSPSTKKSPLIANATAPLKKLDRELYRAYIEAKAEYDGLDKEVKKTATPPKHVRLRLEDTTIEAAQEVLKDSPNGVLCLQDELSGWFGSMDKYSGNRGAAKDRAFWLQSFNGGNYTVNRIGRGAVWIDNLSVSMLGGIQPEPMRKVAGDAVDDGLLQRLFPIVLGSASIGKDEPTPPVVAMYAALVERLHGLSKPLAGGMIEVSLRFDEGAQAVRNELEAKHHAMAAGWEAVNKKLAAHIGKYDGLFARLCAIWHCVESTGNRPASEVKEDTARRVAAFLHDFLFPHAITFYADVLGLSERHDALLATAGWILAHQPPSVT
ncbi:DUF3987 domain-containing protein, partial [Mesorhizobium sp. M7A.F.Ca.ET.027.03.2.1]|uniref:DUF3987 domain-containing protein n=1 Tax=Mesorhizobium sp. M7A.F.Ca.ET.027.03.2.1 TaxID=2496656 RepID=UPI000FCA2667